MISTPLPQFPMESAAVIGALVFVGRLTVGPVPMTVTDVKLSWAVAVLTVSVALMFPPVSWKPSTEKSTTRFLSELASRLSMKRRKKTFPVPVMVTPASLQEVMVAALAMILLVSWVMLPALTAVPEAQHCTRSTAPYCREVESVAAAPCATRQQGSMMKFLPGRAGFKRFHWAPSYLR